MLPFLVLLAVLFWAAALGCARWWLDRASLSQALERGRARTPAAPYDHDEIRGLPDPVVRYFEATLTPGCAFIERATLVQEGTMRTPSVLRFRATSRATTRRPGFIWAAAFAGPFGLRVIDAYADGQGSLDVALLFGVVSLQRLRTRNRPGLAASQLQRWLAETPWYPTALLPRAGVRWDAVDDRSARATITDGLNAASLLFRFGDDAMIESVHTDSRGRDVRGQLVPQGWEGRFARYAREGVYVVPHEGSVRWTSDAEPYWTGTIVRFDYD